MRATLKSEVTGKIVAMTSSLDTDDYVQFLRELAEWAENEASLEEYKKEAYDDSEEEY